MGGTFKAMNKIRPGAYINFETVPQNLLGVGSRGIATMAVTANWGEEGLHELTQADMLNGNYEKMFGDTDRLLFVLMLYGANKALVYKANEGTKATGTIGGITVTAKYGGTFGNKISVGVGEDLTVTTYVDGNEVDSQTVTQISQLIENDYVTFSGSSAPTQTAITPLTGGGNGSAEYTEYFKLLMTKKWNTLACTDNTMKDNVVSLVKTMRETEGVKVQAVIGADEDFDNEAIINVVQKVAIDETEITPAQLTAYVAGITAGADINESNTAAVTPFTRIVDEKTNTEIEEGLLDGKFLFSYTADGSVKCEQDINSLTTVTAEKGKMFKKNRVIRVLDEIANQITSVFEASFMGKINNNDIGRTTFKNVLVGYFNQLQGLNAIQNFVAEDITVEAGLEIDEIIVTANIQPVDSVEKLYMTVKLS
mgnify:FL=1